MAAVFAKVFARHDEFRNAVGKYKEGKGAELRLGLELGYGYRVKVMVSRACLDPRLIATRSSLIVCDHVQSKTRLIVIIAKLGIIYTAWPHNGILSILSLKPQSTYMYRPINTAPGEQKDRSGRVSSSSRLAAIN